MPECSLVPKSYSLFCSTILNSIPTYLLIFYHSSLFAFYTCKAFIIIFQQTHKMLLAHLRKCCSEDDLPTAPWRFLLSFMPFLVLYSFSKVRISPKVTIACYGFCLLRHKNWLERDVISYNGTMFSRVLYYIMNFKIIVLDK